MSGGSYDYIEFKLFDFAMALRKTHPHNVAVTALANHISQLGNLAHDIEWADSCDTAWADNDEKIMAFLGVGKVLNAAVANAYAARAALDEVLNRATAQGET